MWIVHSVYLLLPVQQNNGALGQAALKNHLAVVEFLVNVGFSVNEKQNVSRVWCMLVLVSVGVFDEI